MLSEREMERLGDRAKIRVEQVDWLGESNRLDEGILEVSRSASVNSETKGPMLAAWGYSTRPMLSICS
mgnify:CR=1 FL=1